MNYITILLDKSAFQSLAPREAKWLFHHFRVNLPPVFFAEVLADLTKRKPRTTTAEGDVMALARKIGGHSVHVNMSAEELLTAELRGYLVPLEGQIADARAEQFTSEDGRRGIYIDSTPTQDMLREWERGNFSDAERDFARVWRDGLSGINLEDLFRQVKAARRPNIATSDEVIKLVDLMVAGHDFEVMRIIFGSAAMADDVFRKAVRGWARNQRPPISQFVPYAFLTLRIELYFMLGLAHQVITTRDTNRIDIEYLKYLPFTQTFSSSDALHIDSSRHFLAPFNTFISGNDLKRSLSEIADKWDAVSDEVRSRGTASFADFPPVDLDNPITRIYDAYMPGWRNGANEPKPKISSEQNDRIMAELKPMIDAIDRRRRRPETS